MKKIFLIVVILLFSNMVFSQATYTFTGNGYWSDSANWVNRMVPPSPMPNGAVININPSLSGVCIVNIPLRIPPNVILNLLPGKKLEVLGDMKIDYDSSFTDTRDGQVYTFRQIGTQVWMTKNLNYAAPGSWCYANNTGNCSTYGRLYDWNTAFTVAPPGWHLPSDEEWTVLTAYLGGETVAGGKMKYTTGWNTPNTGATNSSGFAGLPGGSRIPNGVFSLIGDLGFWWSSTEIYTINAWVRGLGYNYTNADSGTDSKRFGFSVRCVRD